MPWRLLLIVLLASFSLCPLWSQQVESDSISTPFRKGRWLTGLSGSISSGSTRLDTASNRAFTNQYSFDISTGKFFRDRWMLGGLFLIQRNNSRQFVDLESESMLLAPIVSFYLTDNPQGSIFFSIAAGYIRFREKTVVFISGTTSEETLKGGGFGLLAQLGYSYVLTDNIAFDLGLGLNSHWANATRDQDAGTGGGKVDVSTGQLIFSFGFIVVLDEFFF